jgi:fibronectin-binding autotransporter adhesin
MNRLLKICCFFALASLMTALPLYAQAVTQTWSATPVSQAFGDPLNWTPGAPLDATDILVITTSTFGQFPIISADPNGQYPTTNETVGAINIGSVTADGILEQDSGNLTVTGGLLIGSANGTGSTFTFAGGSLSQTGGDLVVGFEGRTGTLALSGAAAMSFVGGGRNLYIGSSGDGSVGTVSISDMASLTTDSNLWIGASQTGYLNMNGGSLTCNSWFNIGCNGYGGPGNNAYGSATIDGGAQVILSGGGNMAIGANDNGTSGGHGDLTIQGFSSLTCNNGSTIYVGWSGMGTVPSTLTVHDSFVTLNNTSGLVVGRGNTGSMTLDGVSVFEQTGGGTNIGDGGIGNLTIIGSAQFLENQQRASGRFVIGTPAAGSVATLTLGTLGGSDNPTFTIADVSAAVIGDAGSHVTVNINTGTFNGNSLTSGGYIGFGYGNSVVTWNQNGGLTNFPAGSNPLIGCGNGDNVTLNFNGGVFATPYIKTDTHQPYFAATVNINFNGGTLRANANDPSSTFPFINVRNVGTFHGVVKSGGAIWDTNGFTNTMQYPLVHDTTPLAPPIDGGLTKLGAGTLVLTAQSAYTGSTTVNDGTLQLKTTPIVMHQTTSTDPNVAPTNAGNRGGPGDGPYNLGMRFYVNTPIQVTQLGVFDDLGDGLAIPHVVHISYSATSVEVASLTVGAGVSVGTYSNGYRFLNLDTPITLPAGNNFTVWVESMGGAGVDSFGQNMSTYDSGSGAITPNLTVYQTNLSLMPDQDWAMNSESSATFMYFNPSGYISNGLPITTPVVMGGALGSTPTLDLQGANQQVASLADVAGAEVFGVVTNSASSTSVVLTLSTPSGTTTFSGSIDGNISLVKDGDSVQILNGSLTYTGNTTVNGGTLQVTNLNTPDATVAVALDATLTATSIVADSLVIGGGPYSSASGSAVNSVPEPSTLALLAVAVCGIAAAAWRKR